MTDFEQLQAQANRLIEQQPPALPEIRKLMVEIDEYFNSPDFQELGEQRSELQGLYKELRSRLRGPEDGGAQPATAGAFAGTGFALPDNSASGPAKAREHHPQAEHPMAR